MATADKSFLGTGWSFPPEFSRLNRSVVMVRDDHDIHESLYVLLSTSLGERVMLPGYGSQIWQMVFRVMNNTLTTQLKDMIRQAILNWEPRITVDVIEVVQSDSVHGLIQLMIYYTIRKTNVRSNLVYPFYTQEATIPPSGP